MKRLAATLIAALTTALAPVVAAADTDPFISTTLEPIHDTWATHNDDTVHGAEPVLRVGVEPQACVPGGWDPCDDRDLVCCPSGELPGFCSPPDLDCGLAEPLWTAHRKFRAYLRFDLGSVPAGQVVDAALRLTPVDVHEVLGGPPVVEVYRLKQIGMGDPVCTWNEATLDDTDGTTWSSLPQNVSVTPEGLWVFDVTKAAADWLNGDPDLEGTPLQPNCGFHLADPDFGNQDYPLLRWVDFSSKEGLGPPQLTITVALDLDDDGWFGDCDEEDPLINPAAVELCDGVDNDCDGLADEEDCDGLDNDCDGLVDEGADLCGEGMICIFHQCIVTCQDECYGPYDLKCEKNPEDGNWQIWGCKDLDPDPCKDWYLADECYPGQHCEFGSCSSNCLDSCNAQGLETCEETSVGKPFVAGCQDWDADGCLEWGVLEACGPGQTCADAQCLGGCEDDCPGLGAVSCADSSTVMGCWDPDENGCLEWGLAGVCPEGHTCLAGDCYEPGACEDACEEGATACVQRDDGSGLLSACVADGDADPCTEWIDDGHCEHGCDGDGCAPPPVEPVEPAPDVISWPDGIPAPDEASDMELPEDGGASDTVPGGEVAEPPPVPWDTAEDTSGTDAAGSGAGGKGKGCGVAPTGSGRGWLLLASLLAVLLRRRQPA